MKNKISVLIAVFIFSMLMCVTAFADDPIYVTVNSKEVLYAQSDAQPMIYNSRAMVPIRTTAEALGLSVGWDKATETATFTSADGSRVIRHTMRSNIIYVNGTPSSFDTASIVVKNRILMPIRMLAEAMGAEVTWDNPSRTVLIKTEATKPEIDSADALEKELTEGDEATIVCVTNNATASVKLYYQSGNEDIKEVTDYSDNGDGSRTFKITFVPKADGKTEKIYHVFPGDGTSFYDYKAVNLTVNEDKSKDDDSDDEGLDEYIYKVSLDSTKVEKDDDVEFKVITTDDVERIKVETNYSSKYTTVSTYTESNDQRTFEGKIKATSTGTCYLYIYVYSNELGKYTDDYRIVSFRGLSDGDEEEEKELEIIDIKPSISKTTKGEETMLYVFTTTDIDYVEVYNDDNDRVAYSNYTYDELSTQNVFDLRWTERTSGTNRYKVKAYNEDDDETSETIRIECETNPDSEPFVISIEPKTDNIETGEDTTFIAKCSTGTDYIVIKDEKGRTLFSNDGNSSSPGASYIKFNAKIDEIPSVNCYYTIYAYNDKGDVDTRDFYVYGTDYTDPEITDVDYNATIDEGDSVEVKVFTSTTVSRVWIEDEDDDNVTNKLKSPTRKNTDEYVWEFEFEPDDTGRRIYTIYASSEDEDDYDTATMRIKVL